MHDQGYSQLPIIGPKGNIIGSITDKTFTKLISKGERELHDTLVEEVMEEPFPTVDKNVSVRAVARLLEERRAVIVKDKGNYIGIVTRDNLLRELE